MEGLPDGWVVWNEEPGQRLTLTYRPDVFDGEAFPPACLPTIAVAPGRSPDQLPERRAGTDAWYRAIYLEPTVRVRSADASYDRWEDAVAGARTLAEQFVAGAIDLRAVYHEPREAYLDRLEQLLASER